jgi:hypothetical protein
LSQGAAILSCPKSLGSKRIKWEDKMSQFRMGPSGGPGGLGPITRIWPFDAQFDLVEVRYSNQGLTGFSLTYSGAGVGSIGFPALGGGTAQAWQSPGGIFGDDWITQLDGTYGAGINQLRITMHKGDASPLLGGTAGPRAFIYQIPDGYRFVGFFGCVGDALVNSMGIIIQN